MKSVLAEIELQGESLDRNTIAKNKHSVSPDYTRMSL